MDEMGPLQLNLAPNGDINVTARAKSFTSLHSSYMIMEMPAGVGYSYADTPAGYVTDDLDTAQANLNALLDFYAGFPEFAQLPLRLTGESYAGIYIPQLAKAIVDHNNAGAGQKVPLSGIAVGNGCTGTEVGACGEKTAAGVHFEFLHNRNLFSDKLYQHVKQVCPDDFATLSKDCLDGLAQVHKAVGRVNVYDIYSTCGPLNGLASDDAASCGDDMPGCQDDDAGAAGSRAGSVAGLWSRRPTTATEQAIADALVAHGVTPGPGPAECGDDSLMRIWFNRADVRAALHVASETVTGRWSDCTDKVKYTSTVKNEPRDTYPLLIKAGLDILIYSGDVDACVPIIATEAWVEGMNLPVKQEWAPYYYQLNNTPQVAGYCTLYEGMSFCTVRGAGHMVPAFKPNEAYQLFDNWFTGKV